MVIRLFSFCLLKLKSHRHFRCALLMWCGCRWSCFEFLLLVFRGLMSELYHAFIVKCENDLNLKRWIFPEHVWLFLYPKITKRKYEIMFCTKIIKVVLHYDHFHHIYTFLTLLISHGFNEKSVWNLSKHVAVHNYFV